MAENVPGLGLVDAVKASAARLGISPSDLLTVMSYETGGRLDPNLWGGKGGQHLGLIQFGPEERNRYGVKPGMSVEAQVLAAENFLRDRGLKPGMGLLDVYSTVNAGRPGLYGRSDAHNGGLPGTVADKVATMAPHRMRAEALLGGGAVPALASAAPAVGGAAPFSLAPDATGEAIPADVREAMAAVQQATAEERGMRAAPALRPIDGMAMPAAPAPIRMRAPDPIAINFPVTPAMARVRALARAAARGGAA